MPGGDLRVHETALRSLSPATMLAVMQYVFYETLDAILDLAAACVCQGDIKMPNVFLDHDDLTLLLGALFSLGLLAALSF